MYRGESWAKKIARHIGWQHMLADSPSLRHPRAMVLLGPEGKDVPLLMAFGLDPSQIIGVDRDPAARHAAHVRWPRMDLHPDVNAAVGALTKSRLSLDFCMLDFCGCMSPAIFAAVKSAVLASRNGARLGVTMLAGREAKHRIRAIRSFSALSARLGNDLDETEKYYNRMAATIYQVNSNISPRITVIPELYVVYNSGVSPMLMFCARIERRAFATRRSRDPERTTPVIGRVIPRDAAECERMVREFATTNRDIAATAVAAILGVTSGQVAAWRAVATRSAVAAWLCLGTVVAGAGCGRLPVSDPPVLEEHLTAVAHCDGPIRIVDYERADGTRYGTTIVWMGCAQTTNPEKTE
jgi:hypothetical protein